MLTLREIFDNLKADLDTMPRCKLGTPWHLDRARALFRVCRRLGLIPHDGTI